MFQYYAENEDVAQELQKVVTAPDNEPELIAHIYLIEGEDCNGCVWFKIGQTTSLRERFANYNYPSHFRDRGITRIVNVNVISWEDTGSHLMAEKYLHKQLSIFRHKFDGKLRRKGASEWFTNKDAEVDAEDFREIVYHYWGSLLRYGYVYAPIHYGGSRQRVQDKNPGHPAATGRYAKTGSPIFYAAAAGGIRRFTNDPDPHPDGHPKRRFLWRLFGLGHYGY